MYFGVILAATLNITAIAQSLGLAIEQPRAGESVWTATVWIADTPRVRYIVLAGPMDPEGAHNTMVAAKHTLQRVESLKWLGQAMAAYPDIRIRVSIVAGTKSMPPNLKAPCDVRRTAFVTASEGSSLLWSTWLLRDDNDLELYMFDSTIPRFPFGEQWYSHLGNIEVQQGWSHLDNPGVIIHSDGSFGAAVTSCLPWIARKS